MCSQGGPPHVVGWSTLISLFSYTDMRQDKTPCFCENIAPAVAIQTLVLPAEMLSLLFSEPTIRTRCISNRSAATQRTLFLNMNLDVLDRNVVVPFVMVFQTLNRHSQQE